MYKGLIRVLRTDKNGVVKHKLVRPPEHLSASMANVHRRKHFEKIRVKAILIFGDKCVCCGYKDIRALQIDHIKSDGKNDRHKSGTSYYYHIINSSNKNKYQILCANCNVIKRKELQECPIKKVTKKYCTKG